MYVAEDIDFSGHAGLQPSADGLGVFTGGYEDKTLLEPALSQDRPVDMGMDSEDEEYESFRWEVDELLRGGGDGTSSHTLSPDCEASVQWENFHFVDLGDLPT